MGRGKIWKAILRDAVNATNADLAIATDRLMQTVILFAIYIVLVSNFVGTKAGAEEFELKLLAAVAPLLIYPLVFVFRILTAIPDRELSRNVRLNDLRRHLTPRLEIELLNGGRPKLFQMKTGDEYRFAMSVRNVSTRMTDIVDCFLTEFTGNNGRAIRDAIEFAWQDTEKSDNQWVSIPAQGSRTCKLFYFDGGDIKLPPTGDADDRTFFDGGTTFTGMITLGDRYYGAQKIGFQLDLQPDPMITITTIEPPDPQTVQDIEADLAAYR